MCKCNPESLTDIELERKLDHLTSSISQSRGPRPNTRARVKLLQTYSPCTCDLKYLTMYRAKTLEESIKYLTNPESKVLDNRMVFTNSKDINDIHSCSTELIEALQQYQEAYNTIQTILNMT